MSADIGVIMQLLQRQMALVPPAYSAVSSPPQVITRHHVHRWQDKRKLLMFFMGYTPPNKQDVVSSAAVTLPWSQSRGQSSSACHTSGDRFSGLPITGEAHVLVELIPGIPHSASVRHQWISRALC